MKKNKYFFLIFILCSNLFFLPAKSDLIFEKGKKIFLEQGNCAACHMLADAASNGQIGPNLNEIKPDVMKVINAVTNGIGVMPSYEGELSTEEIQAVSHYVSVSIK